MPLGIPTGFMMRAPSGNVLMFDFDGSGKPDSKTGKEMPMQGWLLEYGRVLPEDVILLVEAVQADGERMLVKCLDSGLLRDGKRKVSAVELAASGKLWDTAKRFWDEYMARTFRCCL